MRSNDDNVTGGGRWPDGFREALSVFSGETRTALTAQAPQTPSFRSSSTLVPVDVRVVDAGGRPVPGLTRDDFVVKEDGRAQDIASFAPHVFTAEAPVAGAAGAPIFRRLDDPDVSGAAPLNQRIFLFVLGRGRLQAPARGIDAVADFLKGQLLPQDAVAVMAWNRATDFTVDHQRIVDVVERYRTRHEGIETALREWFSGLRGLSGNPALPPHIQRVIDEVFITHGGAMTRDLPPAPVPMRVSAGRSQACTGRHTSTSTRPDV